MCENITKQEKEQAVRENDYRVIARMLQKGGCATRETALPGGGTYQEILRSAPVLVILGGGHISLALAKLGKLIGYQTIVVDDRGRFATKERFPEADQVLCIDFAEAFAKNMFPDYASYVVVTRGHENDYECLREVLKRTYTYAGMIGSRKKVAATRKRLLADGFSEEVLKEVHMPIGLSIGAQTPEEIAVSIAAQLIEERARTRQTTMDAEVLRWLLEEAGSMVMATIVEKKGSAPRGTGSRLLVRGDGTCAGTIGGGNVEFLAQKLAVEMLETHRETCLKHYDLSSEAAEAGMVCGGDVKVLFERVEAAE